MGTGKQYSFKEIDSTISASKDSAFEAIIERIENAGGEISEDETVPLYMDIGMQELETGYERTVKFSLNKMDFILQRKTETHRISGKGKQKSLEEMENPRINIVLKRKPQTGQDWQLVDLDALI